MISCGEYDYIEIVCLYRYPIKLFLVSGDEKEGTAFDTQRNADREECIKIKSNNAECLIVLNDIARLEVLVENPHFTEVSFR